MPVKKKTKQQVLTANMARQADLFMTDAGAKIAAAGQPAKTSKNKFNGLINGLVRM